jgi:hypothetical protein
MLRVGQDRSFYLELAAEVVAALIWLALLGLYVGTTVAAFMYGGLLGGLLALAAPVVFLAVSIGSWAGGLRDWFRYR